MKKSALVTLATSKGLKTAYSGSTKTLFVKGNGSEEFVKRFTPDKTGHIRDNRGHFIKGGLGYTVAVS